jgi:translation initiation factor IF-2
MATKSNEVTKQQQRPKSGDGNGAGMPKEIIVEDHITVRKLAERMHRSPIDLIKVLMQFGIMAPIDQALDHDTAAIVGEELGVTVKWPQRAAEEVQPAEPEKEDTRTVAQRFVDQVVETENEANLIERSPVVAVLGHVDHGKTTLLDRIRKTNVVATEAGGITQHTGAYQVEVEGRKITFLDTPGHEAFTSMRARGAQVTDIVVLVVAADDGVMPQTREAINHAKAAGVTIVVAINKVDKANANPSRVMEELAKEGLQPEEWGGDTIMVPLSALTGRGVDDLLANILVVAEIEQYKANPSGKCVGTVIESQVDKFRGVTATLLVQNGALNRGDALVVGKTWGRIKAMFDHEGKQLKKAGPSTPVVVLGLQDVAGAGEIFEVMAKDKDARRIAEERQAAAAQVAQAVVRPQVTLEDFFARFGESDTKTLNIIVRADVQGTLEPVVQSLEEVGRQNEEVNIKILQAAIGDITESDVMLADASQAVIIGFNVNADKAAAAHAENVGVEIRHYDVIYHMIEDVEAALTGMLEPVFEEIVLGRAEVRQLFRVRRGGLIAGCMVLDGFIKRNANARLIRNGEVVATSTIATLKRFTEDVPEVRTGYECGINLAGVNDDMQEGDIIEAFGQRQVR